MNQSVMASPELISRALDRVLPFVQKPVRYTGGEWNSVLKPWSDTAYRLALVFPDVYELGMSNLGMMVLYDAVNSRPDMLAERAYTPWIDMIAAMREAGIPLYSLESRHPLADFDVIGFSLPYEQLYTNVLTTLDLAGIPLRSAERADDVPLVLAGGTACLNPEPMYEFFDAFFVGEGEEAVSEIVTVWTDARRAGLDRQESLRRLACVPGVYVPGFYDVSYHPDGRLRAISPRPEHAGVAPPVVTRRIVPVLPPPVTRFIVPFMDIVHNRAAIEIQRGCTRGCRFCQAGMVLRPVRERPLSQVLAAVEDVVRQTGFEEIGFLSLSSSDYSAIQELVDTVVERFGAEKLSINLPSLRIESFSVELMDTLERGRRRSGFTFAPEAGTDRLRDVINKPIATEALLETARAVYRRGWPTVKLYFMIGHPTQTLEDVQAIADLAHQVRRIGYAELGKKANVRVSVSTLVPKPHTPFQWVPMADEATIREHLATLERQLRASGFTFSWNQPRETLLEATLSRGDRRLANVIWRAWELGAGFDAWADQLNEAAWMQAFAENGLDPNWYARRERALDEVLPWDHISVGVNKRFLVREYERALAGETTGDCRQRCYACGITSVFREERGLAPDDGWGCPPVKHRLAPTQASAPGEPVLRGEAGDTCTSSEVPE